LIDIHAHILPALDDGPKDLDMALEMARIANQDGIEKIIVTPHVIPGEFDLSKEIILAAVADFNQELKANDIALETLPGAENYLDLELVQKAKDYKLMTLNNGGKYVLIELPMQSFPQYTEQIFFELKLLGLTPILAHPERNLAIMEEPSLLYNLISKGTLAQINANSLSGAFGKTVAANAKTFLEHNWVQFMATDCHSCGTRGPRLKEGFNIVSDLVGAEKAEELVLINPQKVINGEAIELINLREYNPSRNVWQKIKSKLF